MKQLVYRLSGALLAGLALAAGAVQAQSKYPSQSIKWVVPFTPGGITDNTSRTLAKKLSDALGQQVIVENRPGGGGMVGTEVVARAMPDGYTWIYGTSGTMAANLALYKKVRYDPFKDFTPVHGMFVTPLVLVVNASRPYKSVAELIAFAKENPGKLNYGSAGTGTGTHLTAELFQAATGIKMVHVPYKGSAPAIYDMLAGEVDVMFDYPQVVAPHITSGKLRALAITSESRVQLLSDVPTIVEAGVPGALSAAWSAILVPAKTPPEIVTRLSDEIAKALSDPELQQLFIKAGSMPLVGVSGAKLEEFMRNELIKWTAVVKRSGAQLD
jgi:tripartite-type tricarboxylate transporter receptor subunit TctC